MTTNTQTQTTLTIVDKATKGLLKVTADTSKIMGDLNGLVAITETIATEIEFKSGELASIEANMVSKLREAKADLAIDIKENADSVLEDMLADRNLATITEDDLRALQARVNRDEFDNQAAIESAVKAAEKSAHAAAAIVNAKQEAAHAVASAKLIADNSALEARIEFLIESNTSLQTMVNDERTARVEMSRNASQPTINVGTGK